MEKKRKFVITLSYTVQKDVEVEAESLEEAKQKAVNTAGAEIKTEDGVLSAICKTLFVRDNGTGKIWRPVKKSA